ncbi:hypothetical protein CsSME_00028458 [Camellia sinensis var. sinensis]
MGVPDLVISMAPPESMRSTKSLSVEEVIQFMVGLDVDFFRAEGDYTDFILTHLMPPLTGVPGDEEAGAPAARARRKVTRASRACGRRASRAGRRADWLELPTMLTCWRHTRKAYQIPIELAVAGHELVGVQGSTSIPPMPMVPAGAAALAPAISPPAAGRRDTKIPTCGRGRARGTRDRSGPSEPILSDDDTEMSDSKEAASQHSESSESADDDTGSGSESGGDAETSSEVEGGDGSGSDSGLDSDSGANGDSAPESPSRKRTKRTSRA